MTERETVTQRCPHCRRQFRVLADEAGSHPCPSCGFGPEDDADYEKESDSYE